jgi:hypothetical protein
MQISGLGGVSAYTKINLSSQMKSVQMPSYGWGKGLIATKTETKKTDEEIKNAMIELAKKDARNGIYGMDLDVTHTKTRQSKEFASLVGEYVQSASPDRKNIYPAAIAQMRKATKLNGMIPIIDDSLTQLLLNGTKIKLKHHGVIYDTKSKMMAINHVEFFIGGERIGSYDLRSGWHQEFTKEELSRQSEINWLYYNTWTAETKQMGMENRR